MRFCLFSLQVKQSKNCSHFPTPKAKEISTNFYPFFAIFFSATNNFVMALSSESYLGFLEEVKRHKIATSSFLSNPEIGITGIWEQNSKLETSIDSTYQNFAKNLKVASSAIKTPREELRAERRAKLFELSLSDDDEIWDQLSTFDQVNCGLI